MDTMEKDKNLQRQIDHMAELVGLPEGGIYGREWKPQENWQDLMMVYEKASQWRRTSDGEINRDECLVYISRFEVGTNSIFISLWSVQANGEFDFTNIWHGHSRLESVQGDCDSTKEMFFKSLADFATVVHYTQKLHGE